jgi:hypothetical protein
MCCLEVYVYLIFSLQCDIRYVVGDIAKEKTRRAQLAGLRPSGRTCPKTMQLTVGYM